MSVSIAQMVGIAMGVIPGINVPAAIIKFFVYLKDDFADGKVRGNQQAAQNIALKVDKVAQKTLEITTCHSNLKWASAIQIIPIIGGIIGGIWEYQLLKKIDELKTELQPEKGSVGVKRVQEKKSKGSEGVVALTDGNFAKTIKNNEKVLVLYVPEGRDAVGPSITARNTLISIAPMPDVVFACAEVAYEEGNRYKFVPPGLQAFPIYEMYIDGKKCKMHEGCMRTREDIQQFIAKAEGKE